MKIEEQRMPVGPELTRRCNRSPSTTRRASADASFHLGNHSRTTLSNSSDLILTSCRIADDISGVDIAGVVVLCGRTDVLNDSPDAYTRKLTDHVVTKQV